MVATKEKAKTAKPGKNPKEEKTLDESVSFILLNFYSNLIILHEFY